VILKWPSREAKEDQQKLIIHADKSRPPTTQLSSQFFEQIRMKIAHPPYSADLAPSSFYLFGHVKGCLAGLSLENADEILESVRGVLSGIDKMPLGAVFLEWIEPLRKYIAIDAGSLDSSEINIRERLSFIRALVRSSCMSGIPSRTEVRETTPRFLCAKIALKLSPLGFSEGTNTKSENLDATVTTLGRSVRSRSPAQPKTVRMRHRLRACKLFKTVGSPAPFVRSLGKLRLLNHFLHFVKRFTVCKRSEHRRSFSRFNQIL
jgi:hypothetical protein